jgi:hypothetical protein
MVFPTLAFYLFLLDRTCLFRRCVVIFFVKFGGRRRRLCLDFSYPVVPFLILISIFLGAGCHLTPCQMHTPQKKEDPNILEYVI